MASCWRHNRSSAKGKVSAEELRGQIGERLPGAFAEFAAATGRSTQELDKALNDGEVTLQDFVKFSERLLLKYEEDAKKIASGPEEAGARLQTALSDLQRNIGSLLQPIGAAFQDTFTAIIKAINGAIIALNQFLGIGTENALNKVNRQINETAAKLGSNNGRRDRFYNERLTKLLAEQKRLNAVYDEERKSAPKPTLKTTDPDIVKTGGGSSGGGSGSSAADQLQRQLEAGAKLAQQFERAKALRAAETDLQKALLDNEYKRQDIIERINSVAADSQKAGLIALANSEAAAIAEEIKSDEAEKQLKAYEDVLKPLQSQQKLLTAKLNGTEKEEALQQKINAAIDGRTPAEAAYIEQVIRGNAALEDRLAAQEKLKEQYSQLASGISGEFTSAFRSIIDGSKSVEEALADMFKGIADKFLDMAMKILQDAITKQLMNLFTTLLGGAGGSFGSGASAPMTGGLNFSSAFSSGGFGISGFAEGGRPPVGKVSLVGENGPELVRFGSPATVYSNEDSQAMMRQSSAMERYSYASHSEPVTPSTINLQTTTIAGTEYLTKEQGQSLMMEAARIGTKEGAKQGERQVYSSLRNSRSRRSRLGL